ncbi:MAG: TonB-dependent receptor [Gammaproteobacteria bacterium]|nr:TonB-dependent receptor [Gammaproteobacteria bacterium]
MKYRLFLISALFGISNLLLASDEVVVTPARHSQDIDEVIPSVIVIDRETIERTPSADVADLLRWYAGVEIGRTGGFGQQTSVFVRGANSNHTAVLINGVKMNSATTGAPALEIINASVIERIEVIKGPRSTVYGSEALGGVINIITTTDQVKNNAAVHISRGRYSTTEQGVDLKFSNDYAIGDFSFNSIDSDGFPATTNSNTDHGHDNETVDINLKTALGRSNWKFGYWQTEGNTEYDSFGTDLDQDRKNDVLNATFDLPITEKWFSSLSISKIKDEIRQNQVNFLGDEDFTFTDRIVYDWKNDISIIDNIFTFGATKTDEDTESHSFGTRYKENTDSYSLYANQQFKFGKHSVFGSTRYVNHDDFGDETLWNAEYRYQLTKKTRMFASLGTGFRAPDSNARFGFGGNPDLKEETSRSIELGMNYDFSQFNKVSLRAYENKIKDLIETILIDPGAFTFENRNVSDARIQGLELKFQHQSKHWHVNLEGTLKNPRNESDDSLLLRRAKRSLNGTLVYKHDKYFVQLNGLLSSERRDFGDVELSGYGLVDLSAGMHFPKATLSVKVDNLFDKDYELASDFNTPGQSVFAELRIKLTD